MKSASDSSSQKNGILAKNTLINIAGRGIPLIFALFAIPYIIEGLGTDRFGVLGIVWTIIGYFGLFDLGLGGATTKFVADQEAEDSTQLSPIIITSIILLIFFGAIGGGLIFLCTPYLIHTILNIPADLVGETRASFYILSISIPLILGSLGARGVLEAQQRFTLVNVVKIPATIINYVAPLLVLFFSNNLQYIVLVLVIERMITFAIFLYYSLEDVTLLKLTDYSFFKWAKKLMGFGSWLAVSNFVSPIMEYMDRFIIGAILTVSAVAYYTTPYEMVSRISIISAGFMGVMFPAFSVYKSQNQERLRSLYYQSIRYLLFILLPILIFLIFAAYPLLYLWLGTEFAQNSSVVLQILAVGVLINCIARVPSTFILAAGRPDIRAKLHIVELPVYLGLLWYLTPTLGIEGVALAWLFRVFIDGCLMFYMSQHIGLSFNLNWKLLVAKTSLPVFGVCTGMAILSRLNSTLYSIVFAFIFSLITLYVTWHYILKEVDRTKIVQLLSELTSNLKN